MNWLEVYDLGDPTLMASKIAEFLKIVLYKMAPLKLRNIKTNVCRKGKLSKECHTLMMGRGEFNRRAKLP